MRCTLPNRRQGKAFEFELDGVHFRAMTTNFPSGEMAEIFLTGGKNGSMADTAARDGAIILSIALQCGTPLETIYAALTKLENGDPAGPIGKAIQIARSYEATA